MRGVPVLATDGSIREWVGTHTDISDRVQVLEALRQSEGQYRSQAAQLEKAVRDLHETQTQLIQTEKISSLRNFSRLDESEMKQVDIHEGIESTLLILQHRLKATASSPAIKVIKEYGDFPKIECYAGQLNQVFMNILANAIDALEEYNSKRSSKEIYCCPNTIWISTYAVSSDTVAIRIPDNGPGINQEVIRKLFDPFFTTKPIGKGTGLGLSISHQIVVEKHRGKLQCFSGPEKGAEFLIEIPICQKISPVTVENVKETVKQF